MVLSVICKFKEFNCHKIEVIWTVRHMDAFTAFSKQRKAANRFRAQKRRDLARRERGTLRFFVAMAASVVCGGGASDLPLRGADGKHEAVNLPR